MFGIVIMIDFILVSNFLLVDILEDLNLLNIEATVIVECSKETNTLENYKQLHYIKEYVYGITKIIIYQKRGDRLE